jgi:hypothetical protein
MNQSAACCCALFVLLASSHATAAELAEDAEAGCAFFESVARSESALAMSPQLFVDYGWINGSDATTSGTGGVSSLPPTQRLTAGLRYSVVGLFQGLTLRQRARAECDRYRAVSALARFVVENREEVSPASLEAKLAVLRGAAGKAREIVKTTRAAVERTRATVEELEAVELRLTALEALTVETEALRAGLPGRTALPPPEMLLRRQLVAEEEVERAEARLRESRAFDLSVRGGYDRVFGLRDQAPLFAVVSLTVNPAAFYQPFADAEARRARVRWAHAQTDGFAQKAELLAQRLRALLAGERRRLRESAVQLADLEGRLRAVEAIDSDRLRRVRDALWFDWVGLKADHEFLRVHVTELSAALGEGDR